MTSIIVDIDGTIANNHHRSHLVEGRPRDWVKFFDLMDKDTPIYPIVRVTNDLHSTGTQVLLVTGRPSNYREKTEGWLATHFVHWDRLWMRAAGDFRPDHVVKRELYEQILEKGFKPTLVIDDRPSVIDMWLSVGLPVLQVRVK